MLTRLYKHAGYYFSLVIILILGFLLAVNVSPNREFQIGVVVMTTFFYVLWGILHHLLNHDLNVKIVVEYALIGGFGVSVIFFLLKSGLGI